MSFDPYIHFQGNCAEAMRFYADLFGATDLQLMRYGDAPDQPPGHDGSGDDLIMHASFTVNGRVLMGSDWPPGMAGTPQASVSISHDEPSRDAAEALFARLSEGAQELSMPFGDTFFADGFGMCRDRFGTTWMVMGPALYDGSDSA